MKQWKELAVLRQRGKKTASLHKLPAARHRTRGTGSDLIAARLGRLPIPANHPEPPPRVAGCHPVCKLATRGHSTQTIATIRRLDNRHRCRRSIPRAQASTRTSPVSNTQITTLRGLFLTGSFLERIDFDNSGSSSTSWTADKITPPIRKRSRNPAVSASHLVSV